MNLTINGLEAPIMKGSSIDYVSENRIFTDADDYSMEIELPWQTVRRTSYRCKDINTKERRNKELKELGIL